MKTNYIRNTIIKTMLSCLIAASFLCAFTLLYKYTSMHVPSNGETDYKWKPNTIMATAEEGFAFLHMDNNGYNNEHTFQRNDILLLGSSHMEAVQIPTEYNVASCLNDLLKYNTYSVGVSGHTLYRCISNYRDAVAEYLPECYTIIETDSIKLSQGSMMSVIDGSNASSIKPDTGIKAIVQVVPASKPILNQLMTWATLKKPAGGGYYRINN